MSPQEIENAVHRWQPTMQEYHAPIDPGGDWMFSAGSLSRVAREGLGSELARVAAPTPDIVETDVAINVGTLVHETLQGLSPTVFVGHETLMGRTKRRRLQSAALDAAICGYRAAILERDVEVAAYMVSSLQAQNTPAKRAAMSLIQAAHRWPEVSHRWEIEPGIWAKVRPDLIVSCRSGPVAVAIKTTARSLSDAEWWPHFRRWWLWSAAFHVYGCSDLFSQPVPVIFITGRRRSPFPWRIDFLTNEDCGLGFLGSGDAKNAIEWTWNEELLPIFQEIGQQKLQGAQHGIEETVRY